MINTFIWQEVPAGKDTDTTTLVDASCLSGPAPLDKGILIHSTNSKSIVTVNSSACSREANYVHILELMTYRQNSIIASLHGIETYYLQLSHRFIHT